MIEITTTIREATAAHVATKPIGILRGYVEQVKRGDCPICGKNVKSVKDSLSLKEYAISGMCQICQDETFS